MKRIHFAIFAGLSCFFISCNENKTSETKSTSNGDKNLASAHAVNKAIETGDVSKLGDYIATDGVDHAGPKGDIKGLDSIKAMLGKIHTMATGMQMSTTKELADDEYVFQWMHFSGTSASAEMGLPPGTKFDMSAIEVSKFKDGKSTEHWEFMQPSDMMKMMGGADAMTDHKMDTVKRK